MKTFSSFIRLRRASVVTIGNFDGFHLGHRAVANEVIRQSRSLGLIAAVITFHPHPRLHLGHSVPLLQTAAQKNRSLSGCRFDRFFDIEFASVYRITAEEFLAQILLGMLKMKRLVFSGDFLFGSDRRGGVPFLRAAAETFGFNLLEVEPVLIDGERVSSSTIRKKIEYGDLRGAGRMLGRPYTIEGTVVSGLGRGTRLGFPTLNLQTENRLLPVGVFATICEVGGKRYPGVTNIGLNPTFPGICKETGVECHLIDRSLRLYGRRIRLQLIEKIRDERRFSGESELIGQIRTDVTLARRLLADELN